MPHRYLRWQLGWTLALLATGLLSGCVREARQTQLMTGNVAQPAEAIEWCGSLALPGKWQDDTPVGGLSDLAWDADESLLYLVSDRGWLHRVRPRFSDGELIALDPLKTYVLRDDNGDAFEARSADAESLILQRATNGKRGDSVLLIGFEGDTRLQRFYPNGRAADEALYPGGLRGAGANRGPEAMARHPREGVIVGLESPPTGNETGVTQLFALDSGAEWRYPLADEAGSALTALAPYGDGLLALERAFAPPAPLVISLRRLSLASNARLEIKTLARLSSGEGWRLDNFEGLTALSDRRFLMVSDDNFSLAQQTLLSCFELPPSDVE